jgi:hypothetical protein
MRWTEQEYKDFLAQRGQDTQALRAERPPDEPQKLAGGRLPDQGMNKTEAAYDAHLWLLRRSGVILWHKFEAIKLRLADTTFYTPDFLVLAADGILEVHETKGFWRDDARVKIKVAAALYPFRFMAITKDGANWKVEKF